MENTNLETSLWSKIKWIISVYLEVIKSSSPRLKWGTALMLASLGSMPLTGLIIAVTLSPPYDLFGLELTKNTLSSTGFILSTFVCIFGAWLIWIDIKIDLNQARKTARVIITGLPGMPTNFPDKILSKAEQVKAREPIELSFQDADYKKQVERYNAEVCVELFKRFVLHHSCEKLYIGGLARVPFLVSYGALIRNASNIQYFDKVHRDSAWQLLNDEDLDIQLHAIETIPQPNENGGIGIAIGFTSTININQLPEALQKSTAMLSPKVNPGKNLIMNQANLQRISESLEKIISQFSSDPNTKKIHLFLSVQSTLAIEIGRKFQEGMHKVWVIHNFNAAEGLYDWSLELSKSGLTISNGKSST